MDMTDTNLPVVSNSGDSVSLTSEGANIASAIQSLVAHLHHRSETFDDVAASLHHEVKPDGTSRSVFSYHAIRHQRR